MSLRSPFCFCVRVFVCGYLLPREGHLRKYLAWRVHGLCRSSRCQWERQMLITWENGATGIRLKYLRWDTRIIFLFQKADPNHILILMHMCVNTSIFFMFFSFIVCTWFRLWFRKFCNRPCASSGRTSLSLVSHMTVIFLVFRSCLCSYSIFVCAI